MSHVGFMNRSFQMSKSSSPQNQCILKLLTTIRPISHEDFTKGRVVVPIIGVCAHVPRIHFFAIFLT